jgi:AraC-like DNA-binding protein
VSAVLRKLKISRTALDKRFLNALGHTPHEEILRVRLKRAAELLSETDLSQEVIADRCGFKHGEYLRTVFLREFGQTAGEFRSQCNLSRRIDKPHPRGMIAMELPRYTNTSHAAGNGTARQLYSRKASSTNECPEGQVSGESTTRTVGCQ